MDKPGNPVKFSPEMLKGLGLSYPQIILDVLWVLNIVLSGFLKLKSY